MSDEEFDFLVKLARLSKAERIEASKSAPVLQTVASQVLAVLLGNSDNPSNDTTSHITIAWLNVVKQEARSSSPNQDVE